MSRHTLQGISFAKYDSRQEISRRIYFSLSTKELTLKTIKHFTIKHLREDRKRNLTQFTYYNDEFVFIMLVKGLIVKTKNFK